MTPEQAVNRLLSMMEQPSTYASVQEGYYMQVWLLLEIAGVPVNEIREFVVEMHGNASHGSDPATNGYFEVINKELLKLLKKRGLV